jgi:glycosyltransferase involved in cell wall biosynthesis
MACGACLVTGLLPDVDGDERVKGRDYIEVEKLEDISAVVGELLDSGEWRTVGQNGKEMVRKNHTWTTRAKQLRDILSRELNL